MTNVTFLPNTKLPKEEVIAKLEELIATVRDGDAPVDKVILIFGNPDAASQLHAWNCSRADIISLTEHTKLTMLLGERYRG